MNCINFKKRNREIKFITLVSLVVNLLLTVFKILIGWQSGFQVLIADGIHSFSDLITDIGIITGSAIFNKPADKNHPYGHGRIETFLTIGIGFLILYTSIEIGKNAILSFNDSREVIVTEPIFYIACVSILLKEFLYRITLIYGKKANSPVLISNAWHHRSDAFSSIPVLVAAIGMYFSPGLNYLDNIATLIVAILLVKASWEIILPAFDELMERRAGEEFDEIIEKTVKSFPEIKDVHSIKTRKIGGGVIADIHIKVSGDKSVRESHKLVHELKDKLIKYNFIDVMVHVEPE